MTKYEQLSLVSSFLYTFTTIILLAVAIVQLRHTRRDGAVRTAMTVMEGETYAPQRAAFLKVVSSHDPDEIKQLGEQPDGHPSEVEALRAVANRYEYIATAIGLGALDYRTYKRLWRGSTLRDWERLKPFILMERLGYKNPNFWIEYEGLVARLIKDRPG